VWERETPNEGTTMKTYWIENGTRSVCVMVGSTVSARKYVDGREVATLVCWKGKTEAGAKKWANKVLGGAK